MAALAFRMTDLSQRAVHIKIEVDKHANYLSRGELLQASFKDSVFKLARAIAEKNMDCVYACEDIETGNLLIKGSLVVVSVEEVERLMQTSFRNGERIGENNGLTQGKIIGYKRHRRLIQRARRKKLRGKK